MSAQRPAFGSHWAGAIVLGAAAAAMMAAAPNSALAQDKEVTVTIKSVKALDKLDNFSKADFFARVTIDGQAFETPVVKQAEQISPNWRASKRVAAGRRDIKLEIFDKDVTKAEPIDINRVNGRRQLEFVVDTRSCVVSGFSTTYKCGSNIVRAGAERKRAEVTFTVEVR